MTRASDRADWVWVYAGEQPVALTPEAYAECVSLIAELPPQRRESTRHGHLVVVAASALETRGFCSIEQRGPWAVIAAGPPRTGFAERPPQRAKRGRRKRPIVAGPPSLTVVPGGAVE